MTENNNVELRGDEDWIKAKKHKFNFAALIMPQFWGIGNGVYLGLLAFIPILFPFIAIYLGCKGTELAYENSYGRPEQFFKKQRRWQYAALVYLIAVIALVAGLMINNNKRHSTQKAEKNQLAEEETAATDPVEKTPEEPIESIESMESMEPIETIESTEPESEEEEVQIYEPNEEGYYILCSKDLSQSVELALPEGFRLYDFSDAYWFACTDMDKENGVTNIFVWIEETDVESEKASMIQQVEETFAMNYFSSEEIGEIQQKQIGDYEISFFSYDSVTAQNRVDEGYRAWTPLGEDYCLCFMIEKVKADVKKIDIEYYLETIMHMR